MLLLCACLSQLPGVQIERSFRHVTPDHLQSIWLCRIFHNYSVKERLKKSVFFFPLQLYLEVFYVQEEFSEILSNIRLGFPLRDPLFLFNCNQTWFFSTDFSMSFSIRSHEQPSSRRRIISCVRTDRHEEANSRFLQLIHAPKNSTAVSRSTFAYVLQVVPQFVPVNIIRSFNPRLISLQEVTQKSRVLTVCIESILITTKVLVSV